MQGKIAVLPAKVSGIHEAPSHIGGHTAWYLVFWIRCLGFGVIQLMFKIQGDRNACGSVQYEGTHKYAAWESS